MTWLEKQNKNVGRPPNYEIRLKGRLDVDWSDWLGGMNVFHEGDITILRGYVVDQSALRGMLTRAWDLNRTIISVSQIDGNGAKEITIDHDQKK